MLSLGPHVPEGLAPLLGELIEAVRSLQRPGAPSPVYACAAGDLPPAPAWPQTVVQVTDLATLVFSDGEHWIRQDTGAAI
ncbi:hypothetical protein [Phenylobacterium sp.]|uniref:hypothetical protein n=1 Tax=Phenylobacterium sp. TaxID=1871053 RepID=UPI0019BB7F90|nr:hypothetical protein [Phenylobacterium sp.]MBC7167848.1 hypothetical protein [Phenylobacterium sp.]